MTSNKKEHPLQAFAKLVHDHRKGIIGTLTVVFAAFLLSVGTVYISDSGLQGSFARSRASQAGLSEAKPAKSLSYVSCRDTDMENDPTVGGTVTIVGMVGPDRQYLSQKDMCRENVNTEYECNTAIFPKAGGKVKKTDIPEGVSFWDEAGSAACASGCGGDDRCAAEEVQEDNASITMTVDATFDDHPGRIIVGSNDAVLYKGSITAHNGNVIVHDIDISIGEANDYDNSVVRGSFGSNYFDNIKIINLETGEILMGPLGMLSAQEVKDGVSDVVDALDTIAHLSFNTRFLVEANQTIRFGITADIAQFKDASADKFINELYRVRIEPVDECDFISESSGNCLPTNRVEPVGSQVGSNFMPTNPRPLGF